jgi:hypothetical protein
MVHTDWVSESQTINQVYYEEVLTTLRQQVGRKTPEMWMNGSRILHHDNTQAHNTLSVKTILVKHKIPVLEHPLYSSDLGPCDFPTPKDQVCTERNPFRFRRCSEGKSDEGNDEATSFQQWKIRMERCGGLGADNFDADNISIV